MDTRLHFEANENSGYFVYPDERPGTLLAELDDLLDARESGRIDDNRYIDGLVQLLRLEPDFIDAHAHLSFVYLQNNNPQKALRAALAGLKIGNRLIPEGFSGTIIWASSDNRPYLRALQGAILAYVNLRRHKDAVTLIDKLLTFNPNDNQGIRLLLGSELLRIGETERAANVFAENASLYPPYYYEMGLLHILNNDWTQAATALRQGFSNNFYIAEIICGCYQPQKLPIWHGTNYEQPRSAIAYIEMYGDRWYRHPEAQAFVRWLFNHSRILAERASLMKCLEGLFTEKELEARGHIIETHERILNGIDHRLSEEIVKKVRNLRGEENWPWMHTLGCTEI
ncbi:tetratricopeptide repeat protein [Pseudomonas putida]|uniref:tetratricopeptide repeat protein n=1 Tax=Pseudomonas putida TaxID=303 RepID=UPI002B24860E|nr:tetratricopeptide repeat protein [Pseudomonas putida]